MFYDPLISKLIAWGEDRPSGHRPHAAGARGIRDPRGSGPAPVFPLDAAAAGFPRGGFPHRISGRALAAARWRALCRRRPVPRRGRGDCGVLAEAEDGRSGRTDSQAPSAKDRPYALEGPALPGAARNAGPVLADRPIPVRHGGVAHVSRGCADDVRAGGRRPANGRSMSGGTDRSGTSALDGRILACGRHCARRAVVVAGWPAARSTCAGRL